MSKGMCGQCKFGHKEKPGGQMPSPGTVWCSKRTMQMGKQRKMSCFVPLVARHKRQCIECKYAKHVKPHGGTPEPVNVWCDKRHFEIQKLRKMECFEAR
jgi:hypothetical protein